MVRPTHVVVTGTYRSGTTFVERLIDNLSDGFCAPQPFPFLYLAAKRRFLAEIGLDGGRYPIGTGFHDPLHQPDALAAFLESALFDRRTLDEAFLSMRGYSGAKTPELADVIDRIPEGTLADVVRSMHGLLSQQCRPDATLLASKEFLLEEFVPTFDAAGVAVMIVVRDPRAVIASTAGPASGPWTGAPRPLLFTIRLWRKSVAYALKFAQTVAMARLEDLTEDPAGALAASLQTIGIEVAPARRGPLLSAGGEIWQANTSFPEGTAAAGPRFGLSDRQLAYVEALAGPEMIALGYPMTGAGASVADALEQFRAEDDPGRAHPVFAPDFSVDQGELALERERLQLLGSDVPVPDEPAWFVLPGVQQRLASAVAREAR